MSQKHCRNIVGKNAVNVAKMPSSMCSVETMLTHVASLFPSFGTRPKYCEKIYTITIFEMHIAQLLVETVKK